MQPCLPDCSTRSGALLSFSLIGFNWGGNFEAAVLPFSDLWQFTRSDQSPLLTTYRYSGESAGVGTSIWQESHTGYGVLLIFLENHYSALNWESLVMDIRINLVFIMTLRSKREVPSFARRTWPERRTGTIWPSGGHLHARKLLAARLCTVELVYAR